MAARASGKGKVIVHDWVSAGDIAKHQAKHQAKTKQRIGNRVTLPGDDDYIGVATALKGI